MPTGQELEQQKKVSVAAPILTTEESQNLRYWQTRLEHARDLRDQPHQEFDSMTYLQYLESNERLWNSTIEPKTEQRDWRSRVKKRTVFSKGNAILGRLMEENFMSEFSAIDEHNVPDDELAKGLTDSVEASKKIEKSPFLEFAIGQEMLKHGHVFVQEVFEVSDKTVKKFLNESADPFGRKWKVAQEPHKREPRKRIIRHDSVFLGDLSKTDIDEQPYVAVRTKQNYEVAKSIFGSLPRWEYVKPGLSKSPLRDDITYLDSWRLGSLDLNEVEIIECQDPWNDEYQILIQGIPMLPVGYPIPWDHKGYNLRMRGIFLINPHFAYMHGLAHVMRSDSEIRDFFLRYMADRNLQDLLQPMVSAAKRTLTSRIFIPGNITHDLKPEDIRPVLQGQLPQSAIQMYEIFEKSLDEDSISKVIAGQEPGGQPTAYQISVQQRMAQRALGSIVLNYMWLLQDLDFLRAQTIMEHYTKPKATKIDPLTKEVSSVYQSIALDNAELGEGRIGSHLIKFQPKTTHPSPVEILEEQEELEKKTGTKTKVSYIDGEMIRTLRYRISNVVKSSPRKNSDTNKILFGDFLNNVVSLFGSTANMDYLQNEFARVWDKDPEKVFRQGAPAMPALAMIGNTAAQAKSQMRGGVIASAMNNNPPV